jgi:spore coat polysaccharide biosynthesis protein SpsF (cytidylyltransferase family)
LIGAVVQARTGSTRLPGKVLRSLRGQPLLVYVLERLERARRLDALVVATSTAAVDDAVAELCAAHGVACFRGPLDDVAARFVGAAAAHGLDAIVRVSGDSPLLDQALVDRGVELYGDDVDLVTNVSPRTFPPGQSVEVVRTEALRAACAEMAEAEDREHVTRHLYAHPGRFRIRSFAAARDYGGLRLVVDTGEDFERVEAILGRMTRPHWDYGLDEVVELAA